MGDTDPIVLALCRAVLADCEDDRSLADKGGVDLTGEAYLAAAARLSAVLAAARAVVANREGVTGPEATMTRRVINLGAALAAADGAM